MKLLTNQFISTIVCCSRSNSFGGLCKTILAPPTRTSSFDLHRKARSRARIEAERFRSKQKSHTLTASTGRIPTPSRHIHIAISHDMAFPPPPTHVLETILYVKDIAASKAFYSDILRLKSDIDSPDMASYPLGHTTLLLFKLGGPHTTDRFPNAAQPRDIVPKHGPDGHVMETLLGRGVCEVADEENEDADGNVRTLSKLGQHYALAVDSVDDVKAWEAYFEKLNNEGVRDGVVKGGQGQRVKVLGSMNWARGGRSVYFEDPDGHVGEIGSRGIWAHY